MILPLKEEQRKERIRVRRNKRIIVEIQFGSKHKNPIDT